MAWNAEPRYAPTLPAPEPRARGWAWRPSLVLLGMAIFLMAGAVLAVWHSQAAAVDWIRITRACGKVIRSLPLSQFLPQLKANLLGNVFFSPWFYIGVLLILALEWLFPVEPKQNLLSVGLAQDAVWLLLQAVFVAATEVTYVYILTAFYQRHLGFMTFQPFKAMSGFLAFCWAVLLIDFLGWLHHFVRHKVTWLWHFHTVHHSQRQLNQFTDLRYHIVEYIVTRPIRVLPLLALAPANAPTVIGFTLFATWYSRLYHGNIRSNFGILRYVLVTPQSHRVHHSIDPRHFDKNFGVLFCVWDQIFGTQYRHYDEYPPTGIPDPTFPHEETAGGFSLIRTPLAQLAYPFRLLVRTPVRPTTDLVPERKAA